MTIDLDELRRLADEVVLKDWRKRSAGAWKEKWVENERGHEVVRGSAEQTAAVSFIAAANPATVLALLDRLAAAERTVSSYKEAVTVHLNADMTAILGKQTEFQRQAGRLAAAEALLRDVASSIRTHRTDTFNGGVDDEAMWSEADRIAAHLDRKDG